MMNTEDELGVKELELKDKNEIDWRLKDSLLLGFVIYRNNSVNYMTEVILRSLLLKGPGDKETERVHRKFRN